MVTMVTRVMLTQVASGMSQSAVQAVKLPTKGKEVQAKWAIITNLCPTNRVCTPVRCREDLLGKENPL